MSITYEYDKEKGEVYSKSPKILTNKIIETYFKELISRKNEINGAYEVADFTGVETFDTQSEEIDNLVELYKHIAKSGIIVKTIFKVKTPHQYGMSRMFRTLVDSSENEFEFEFVDWRPN